MVVARDIAFCHALQPHCQWRLFRRVLGHAIRYGEAQNPGPDSLLFGLCNPTSLANKVPVFRDLLQKYHCHFVAAAETSATTPTQALVARNLKKLGFFSAFTTPAPSLRARQDQQVSLRGKATGCANFSLFPMRFARCPKPIDPGMDLRFMHVIVDEWKMQIITIYGLTSSHSGAQDFTNALLALAAQRVKQVNLPAIVMGDFNADVNKLLASSDFASMGFLHLQQLYDHMYGEAMPPSCKEATNPDAAFLSPELASRLKAISVLPDPLFDAHKVVTFELNNCGGPWLKQVWPKPQAFTSFALPAQLLEEASHDLQGLEDPCTLEEWGIRVEQTVDVALRKAPVSANLPKRLPASFRGRCQQTRPKTILVTDLVPKARHGDFEPSHEIHGVRTASFIKQLRRIQSLHRKLSRPHKPQCLGDEWSKILRFHFQRKPFVFWIQSVPELGWVPAALPPPRWLFDVEQLWKHEVEQAIALDTRIHQDKLLFRQKLDARFGHNKLTFASVRGSTPTLESIEKEIAQTAICVPLSGRCRHKQAEQFEAFVESPAQFQLGQPISLDGVSGWLKEVKVHSLIVSCSKTPHQLEEVEVRQRVLTTNPAQICHRLSQFWQPLWERDDSHLLTPDLDCEFGAFLDRLPQTELSIDCQCLDTWTQVIKSLKWNAAPGPDGITAFELQSLPISLIASLIKVVNNYQEGFPTWFMAAKVFGAPKGDGVPEPSRIRPITVLSQIYRVWAQVICRQALRCLGLSMTQDITGLLPGRGAYLAAYHTQWFFEQAHFQQEPCAGVTLDLVKCLNVVFPHLSKTYACTCAPRTRLRGKQNVCTRQSQSVIVAKPEHQFVQACLNQTLTQQHIEDIKHHYPIFTLAFAADPRNRKLHVDITPDRLAKCQRRLTVGLARDLLMFVTQTEWLISSEPEGPRVPWLLLFLAFCSHSPTVHTHFVQCKSLHASVCMFRSALGWIWKLQGINVLSAKHISSLQEFGLGRFSGFCGSVTFVNPVPIWFFLVRFAIARNSGEPPDCEFASIHKYHLD